MSYLHRANGASSALSHTSSTSVSTPSTVVHISNRAGMDTARTEVVSTDPNPMPTTKLTSTGAVFRGKDHLRPAENRVLPTSNFLINRHKLLRKTEEGKVLHEGGTLSGTRQQLRSSTQNLTSPTDIAIRPDESSEVKNVSSVTLNIGGNKYVEEKQLHNVQQRPEEAEGLNPSDTSRLDSRTTHQTTNEISAEAPTRQFSSVRWSPTNNRPQVPPKPAALTAESRIHLASTLDDTDMKSEESVKQKLSRGILRVPSLRRSMTRSRTPSQDRQAGGEEKVPKKKEEFLHESVVYTKTKAEPPLSGNRQHLLRGKQSNMTTTSRVEVSAPQFVNSTADQSGATTIQIRGPRIASPSPQRTEVIPAPIQSTGRGMIQVAMEREPVALASVEPPIAPVYARLSETRTTSVKTTRDEEPRPLPAVAAPSPAPSGFIKPQIRPTPPRKPIRTEITESLLEVLPQKAKRQAPAPPPPASLTRQNRSEVVADVHINQAGSRPTSRLSVANHHINNPAIRRVASPERPVSHLKTTESLLRRGRSPDGSSYAGHMTFDDEFDSIMSSSHVDYDHSSADEADDLVKRSLVKASNRRAPIEDIEEENIQTATVYVEVAPPPNSRSNLQPEYDRLPQRPVRQVITRKSSFLSSAEDSDSSRGHPTHVQQSQPQQQRSTVTTTRISRKEADTVHIPAADSDARQVVARDDSAGRRKYDERRQVLRNFENGLQRRRIDSSKTSSSIDSDTMDRDDRLTQQQQRNTKKIATQSHYSQQRTGQPLQSSSRSRYADHESDDGASDSVGIPEPLPEYEYPSRVQGRTIKEMQEIRETVRLRDDSSTSSETGRSPGPAQKRDHHFSRHFDISAEELNTARSLIHHRLPPSYPDQPVQQQQQPALQAVGSRLSLADRSRTPPPTRPIMGGGYSRPGSQSPDIGRLRPAGRLPPQQQVVRGPPPTVHHSDGETRYFPEKKAKKKLGIVRRLSELVRGEKKYKRDVTRKSSTSSLEQEQENRAPVMTAGVQSRRLSPIRRYQDQPLRPVVHNPAGSNNVSRVPSFNRPIPNPRDNTNRHSGNFSDTGTASFVYQDQPASQIPVYAQPNKLQKQQNIGRYRSMSEYDMDRVGAAPLHDLRYVDKPMNPAKSVESISESVWREKLKGRAGRYNQDPPDEKFERVTRTTLVPWGKNKNKFQPAEVRNATYRSGIYDKNAQHYSSTPVLPTMGQIDYRMAPPMKPPRRYDYETANRSSDSDPSTRLTANRSRGPEPGRSASARQQATEIGRPDTDLHLTTRSEYSEPIEVRRQPTTSTSSGGEDTVPRTNRFQTSVYTDARARQADHRPTVSTNAGRTPAPAYARTRIAANDYANRRYQSAGAEMNRPPAEPPLRRLQPRDASEERRYKSSYKMLIENPAPSRSVVQERSRFFSNPPPRREVAVRR